MPRKNLRRAASKEALKQMQLLSATAYEDDETETFEITSDDDVVSVDMPPKKKYRLSHRKSSDGNDRDVIVLKSINAGEELLKLEAWAEELTPVQLEMHNKAEKELQELTARIEQITKQATAEVIYQGESCSAYEIDTSVVPPLAYTTGKEPKKKSTAVASSKAQQQSVVIQPTKSNNSYQLVMDPRLGLIVGTMTPAAGSGVPPPLAKPQSPAPAAVQTRQTRRRGRNSVHSVTTVPQPQQPTPPPPPPPPPPKVQKPTPPAPAPVVQLRPTESTAVGGLSTGSAPVPKNNTTTTSTIVDLTADDGRPAADSREVSFNKLQGKTFPSLVVVARPHLGVKDISGGDRTKLDSKVKSVLMHVPTKFTEWLIQQGLVRSEQNCANHSNSKLKLGMYSDVSKFPYSGGYVWISECCPHRFVSVFSSSLFEGSPHPPSVILKLIYHWACQTNVQNVVQWVKVDNLYVKGMNTWLRALCTVALHSHVAPLGGPGRRVEVGVISLGTTSQDGQQRQVKVEVLGLLETDAKLIRLRAVEPLADGDRNYKKRFSKILEPLLQWVHPESTIVTDLTVDKSTLHTMGFSHVQQSTSSDHNLSNHTIMEYLRRIVPRMFQNTLSLLSRQIIQQFLDELVWREWYGTTAAQCFDNMLTHLSEQTRADTGQSLIMRLNKVAANPFKNWSITTSNQPTTIITKPHINEPSSLPTKRTSGRQRKIINVKAPSPPPLETLQRPPRTISPDIPEQMVPLENYYYGTIEGQNPNANTKIGWNIKCSMCKSHFSNNIRLMTHLFTHAHNVTGGIQQCRYCLSSVGSLEGLAKHIITSHPYESRFQDGFVCVICETRFANSFSLGKHLSKEHVPAELPYQCGTCGFRCSSHRQAIDHFYKSHDAGSTIQCPFCLKSTTVCSSGRIMPQNLNFFMQHLQKHQKKAMAKKCPKCALWFIHKDTLKEHQINMHSTQRRKGGLIPWSAPRNGLMVPKSKQDKQVWEDTEREINFSNLTIDAPNKLVCKECKMFINMPRHYQSLESCTNRNCQYLTCCKSAMDTHKKICKDLNESLPIFTLPKEMHCVCGYSDDDGNTLAKHLAECERKSAYPSADAAKKAIKTHSMLDVLGLVRRPEEPANPQPVVEVIDLDKDDKDEPVNKSKDPVKKTRRLLNKVKEKNIVKVEVVATKSKEAEKESNVVEIKDDDDDDKENKTTKKQEESSEISKKQTEKINEEEELPKDEANKVDKGTPMEVDSTENVEENYTKVVSPINEDNSVAEVDKETATVQEEKEKVENLATPEEEKQKVEDSATPQEEKDKVEESATPEVEEEKVEESATPEEEVEESATPEVEEEKVEESATPQEEKDKVENSATPEEEKEKVKDSATPQEEKDKVEESATPEVEEEKVEESATPEEEVEESATPEVEEEKVEESATPKEEEEKVEESATPEVEEEKVEESATPKEEQEKVEESATPEEEEEKVKGSATPEEEEEKVEEDAATPQDKKGQGEEDSTITEENEDKVQDSDISKEEKENVNESATTQETEDETEEDSAIPQEEKENVEDSAITQTEDNTEEDSAIPQEEKIGEDLTENVDESPSIEKEQSDNEKSSPPVESVEESSSPDKTEDLPFVDNVVDSLPHENTMEVDSSTATEDDSFTAMEVDSSIEISEKNIDISENAMEVMETDAVNEGAHE